MESAHHVVVKVIEQVNVPRIIPNNMLFAIYVMHGDIIGWVVPVWCLVRFLLVLSICRRGNLLLRVVRRRRVRLCVYRVLISLETDDLRRNNCWDFNFFFLFYCISKDFLTVMLHIRICFIVAISIFSYISWYIPTDACMAYKSGIRNKTINKTRFP